MNAHKYFAVLTVICFALTMATGYQMVSGKGK